jgi:hypothetical protein
MPQFPIYAHDTIIQKLKELKSIRKTSIELGCSYTTVYSAKVTYNKEASEKLTFKRGGFNRERKEIKTIHDLSPVAFKIAKFIIKNPSMPKFEVAHHCNTSAVYVGQITKKIRQLNLI